MDDDQAAAVQDADDEFEDDEEAGEAAAGRRARRAARGTTRAATGDRSEHHRTSPAQFTREIRDEMRQVAWPTRSEMVNYTAVVLTTLVIMILLIFALNYVYGKAVLFMFQK